MPRIVNLLLVLVFNATQNYPFAHKILRISVLNISDISLIASLMSTENRDVSPEKTVSYYNEKRIKQKLGWLSPVNYRLNLLAA